MKKSTSKKVNPRRRPLSEADVIKIQDSAVHLAFAIFLTILFDYHGFSREQIQDVWHQADKLSQEVTEGRINIRDLVGVIKEEYGVILE